MSPLPEPKVWTLSPARVWTLSRPHVLGILNVTPDSFSDGGLAAAPDDAVRLAARMLEGGADGIDIGGESTRPGAQPVDASEQVRRTVPAIELIRRTHGDGFAITIDTTREAVARRAIEAGADAVNDISAGRDDPAMLPLVAELGRGIVLMHRLRAPALDSFSTAYVSAPDYSADGGVAAAVLAFLQTRAQEARNRGVRASAIVLDPGLGFGKSVEDNLTLIAETGRLAALGYPVMSGLSRKSFVTRAAALPDDTPPARRVQASLSLSIAHLAAGAMIFRVHDVPEHVPALRSAWSERGRW